MGEVGHLPAPIRVSAGVAGYHPDMSDEMDLLKAADEALYEAKKRQRRFVVKRHRGHVSAP